MFADRLRGLRKKAGLTQEDAAKVLDVARTTYSGYERGTSEPDFNVLHKLSNYYGVDLNWLITGEVKSVSGNDGKILEDFLKLNEADQVYILDLMKRLKKEQP